MVPNYSFNIIFIIIRIEIVCTSLAMMYILLMILCVQRIKQTNCSKRHTAIRRSDQIRRLSASRRINDALSLLILDARAPDHKCINLYMFYVLFSSMAFEYNANTRVISARHPLMTA